MADRLEFSTERVFTFVAGRVPLSRVEGMSAIGLERNGELIAGVVYEGFNGHNIFMHVAAQPGARWLTRSYLRACFAYPFEQCRVHRITGYVEANNLNARRFDEHIGFTEEARLRGAASDGGDAIIYVMYKKDCRYVDSK